MGKKGSGVKTFKDTFWGKKRVEANITIRELAGILKLNEATLGAYLTGCLMPNEHTVKAMCDWFGVDYLLGTREFLNAHKSYDAERNNKTVKYTAKPKGKAKISKETKPIAPVKVEEKKVSMSDADKVNEIARLVYGKGTVDYDLFWKLKEMPIDKIEETLYSKVDYAVFKTVEKILEDKFVKVENFDKWAI